MKLVTLRNCSFFVYNDGIKMTALKRFHFFWQKKLKYLWVEQNAAWYCFKLIWERNEGLDETRLAMSWSWEMGTWTFIIFFFLLLYPFMKFLHNKHFKQKEKWFSYKN